MLDIGFTKLLIIGGLALVVIGPERLPRVARTAGTLLGRAQRYVSEVQSEVSRSMELDELKRTKQAFESSLNDVRQSVDAGLAQASQTIEQSMGGATLGEGDADVPGPFYPVYQRPDKKWRMRRAAVPHWYKQQQRVQTRVQSGAARVARFRPPGISRRPRG